MIYGMMKLKNGHLVTVDLDNKTPDENDETGLERFKKETGLRVYPIKISAYSSTLKDVARLGKIYVNRKPRRSLRIKKVA